jgi:hypothetical protein
VSGALIWLSNVLIFGLWYWQLDRGGPGRRAAGQDGPPDFQFTQMQPGNVFPTGRPQFGDYLYLALTNGTAVSPTDVMPLTLTAKGLMGLQSPSRISAAETAPEASRRFRVPVAWPSSSSAGPAERPPAPGRRV